MAVYKNGKKTSDLNVQVDFNESDTESAAFIKNMPSLETVGEDGSYIKTVAEETGVMTVTSQKFDTEVSSSSTDNNAPTSKAVFTETDKKPDKEGNNTFTGENKFTGALILPTKASKVPGAIWLT